MVFMCLKIRISLDSVFKEINDLKLLSSKKICFTNSI